jgi:broad specificity phosphatase PhoE
LRQARERAASLAGEGVDRIVSSPQLRAQNTAAPLAERLGLAIHLVEGLAEVDRYADRYLSLDTIRAQGAERWNEFVKSPARFFGRDEEAFRGGVLAAVEAILIAPEGTTVAIFTHGMPIRTIVLHVRGESSAARFPIDHCSVSRVSGASLASLRVHSVNELLAGPPRSPA